MTAPTHAQKVTRWLRWLADVVEAGDVASEDVVQAMFSDTSYNLAHPLAEAQCRAADDLLRSASRGLKAELSTTAKKELGLDA